MGYLGAAILSVAGLYRVKQARWARSLGWLGFGAETIWIFLRGVQTHAFPMATLAGWVAVFVWVAVGLYLGFARSLNMGPVGAFLFPVVFVVWLASQVVGAPRTVAIPDGWVLGHVLTAALSGVSFLLAAVFGIMYIEKERELRSKRVHLFYYQLPPLEDMDLWLTRFLGWGWALYTAALVFGALALGGSSLVTVKAVWSVAVWALYGVLCVARARWHWHGHRLATWSMVAFVAVLVNVFAVNAMFPGPHHAGF